MTPPMEVRNLGRVEYIPTYESMQQFTQTRDIGPDSTVPDQLWICEHPPVYTQGLAGKAEHIFRPGAIPVIQTNPVNRW